MTYKASSHNRLQQYLPFCFGQRILLSLWLNLWPNAAAQPRLEAGATQERKLSGVGFSRLFGQDYPLSHRLSGFSVPMQKHYAGD
jgi:hypothetical protein